MSEFEDLTNLFRTLGARDPESWALSQVSEGINQLGRFLFLRQAWRKVIDDNDVSWIDREISEAEKHPNAPFSGTGIALKKILGSGADPKEISEVARGMQADLLFSLCSLLDDPAELEDEVKDISWCLVQLSEDGQVVAPIQALHESVLETDPTGREMRPRPARN
ncbi:MAG: hypothetical protein ACKVQJ_07260 [Pyrinomonadaceae bacterium]